MFWWWWKTSMMRPTLYLTMLMTGLSILLGPVAGDEPLLANPAFLRRHLQSAFSVKRSHQQPESKLKAHQYVLQFFKRLSMTKDAGEVSFYRQPFEGEHTLLNETLQNTVYVLKGSRWHTSEDRLSILGAHIDSQINTPGVDDNGSGMAALLETARLLTSAWNCERLNSIMFVVFDAEEIGLQGSRYFVQEHLVPAILANFSIPEDVYQGAFILDTIMNYDNSPNTQDLPQEFSEYFPEFYALLRDRQFRGNFLALFGRREDSTMSRNFLRHWNKTLQQEEAPFFECFPIPVPSFGMRHFYRSDHANFWGYRTAGLPRGLKAVFLTDTANFRGYMQQCYHNPCDTLGQITDEMLDFLAMTTHVLTTTLLEMSTEQSDCHADQLVSQQDISVASVSEATHRFDHTKWIVPVVVILVVALIIGLVVYLLRQRPGRGPCCTHNQTDVLTNDNISNANTTNHQKGVSDTPGRTANDGL